MPQNTDYVPGSHNIPPYSPAAESNKGPIGEVLQDAFAHARSVLEIASGTGQHAVHMAGLLPHLTWQPSDLAENLPGLVARHALEATPNLLPPIELDIALRPWPVDDIDAIFAANCLHIVSWSLVEAFFDGAGAVLAAKGCLLAVYGPFKYGGAFTTTSNADFDAFLRARDPAAGIRDFEAVDKLAEAQGLKCVQDHAMPANNQLLVWQRA